MSAAVAHAPIVSLRRARAGDRERVWEYNFAPDVRALSRDVRVVTFAEHARWYERRLERLGDPMWIVEEDRVAVGVIRLDRIGAGDVARISIALSSRARGRGIGRRAIEVACQAWNKPIIAEILASNVASRACFESCEFEQVREHGGLLTYHWNP